MSVPGVEVTAPAPRGEWRRLLQSDPEAMASHSPEMVDAARALGWRDGSRLYRFDDGLTALLPALRQGFRAAARIGSMAPGWGFGGLLADDQLTVRHLRLVAADLRTTGAVQIHLRPDPRDAGLWTAALDEGWLATPARASVLDLTGGFDEVWSEHFSKSTRRHVRRAQRVGVSITEDSGDASLHAFMRLLRHSVSRWAAQEGEPVLLAQARRAVRDPARKLRAMRDELGPAFRLYRAHHEGHLIAAAVVLQGDRSAHYTRGATDIEVGRSTGAPQAMHAEAIRRACEEGCRSYHMGESNPDSGVERFKAGFGAVPISYATYRYERLPLTAVERRLRMTARKVLVRPPGGPRG